MTRAFGLRLLAAMVVCTSCPAADRYLAFDKTPSIAVSHELPSKWLASTENFLIPGSQVMISGLGYRKSWLDAIGVSAMPDRGSNALVVRDFWEKLVLSFSDGLAVQLKDLLDTESYRGKITYLATPDSGANIAIYPEARLVVLSGMDVRLDLSFRVQRRKQNGELGWWHYYRYYTPAIYPFEDAGESWVNDNAALLKKKVSEAADKLLPVVIDDILGKYDAARQPQSRRFEDIGFLAGKNAPALGTKQAAFEVLAETEDSWLVVSTWHMRPEEGTVFVLDKSLVAATSIDKASGK